MSFEGIKSWFKIHWRTILIVLLLVERFYTAIYNDNSSFGFAYKKGDGQINIELHDQCLDSLEEVDLNDMSTFVPQKPKWFVVHCTASEKDQTEQDLWRIFRERFHNGKPGYHYAINFKGDIIPFAPVDATQYLEWHEIVNGVKNMNSVCISVAITGGRKNNTMTREQLHTLRYLYLRFKAQFPQLQITTHREVASKDSNGNGKIDPQERIKDCPQFDANQYF